MICENIYFIAKWKIVCEILILILLLAIIGALIGGVFVIKKENDNLRSKSANYESLSNEYLSQITKS